LARQGDQGRPGGLEAAAERLQEVARCREGAREELVALFVALLRAAGLLARTVRQGLFSAGRLAQHCRPTA
jgi:hypothetical protein